MNWGVKFNLLRLYFVGSNFKRCQTMNKTVLLFEDFETLIYNHAEGKDTFKAE
jgi:hypothetical protein